MREVIILMRCKVHTIYRTRYEKYLLWHITLSCLHSAPLTRSHCLILTASVCRIGTAGIAVQVVGSNWPKPHYTLLITGLCRFKVISVLKERPFVFAEVKRFLCQKSLNMFIEIVVKMSQGLKGAMCLENNKHRMQWSIFWIQITRSDHNALKQRLL